MKTLANYIAKTISPFLGFKQFLFAEYMLPPTLKILSLTGEKGGSHKYFLLRGEPNLELLF